METAYLAIRPPRHKVGKRTPTQIQGAGQLRNSSNGAHDRPGAPHEVLKGGAVDEPVPNTEFLFPTLGDMRSTVEGVVDLPNRVSCCDDADKSLPLHIRTRWVSWMGLGVTGSYVVDQCFAHFSLLFTFHSNFKELDEMPELYPNLCIG